jgi:hypothetical protein
MAANHQAFLTIEPKQPLVVPDEALPAIGHAAADSRSGVATNSYTSDH